MKIDDDRIAAEDLPVFLAQDAPASGGKNCVHLAGQLGDDVPLDVAKPGFTFPFEERPNGTPDATFNDGVGIDEPPAKTSGDMTPYGGLATTGHGNQCYSPDGCHAVYRFWLSIRAMRTARLTRCGDERLDHRDEATHEHEAGRSHGIHSRTGYATRGMLSVVHVPVLLVSSKVT